MGTLIAPITNIATISYTHLQIPSELIQLDPDCISKLKTNISDRTGGGEGEGEKGKRQSKNRGGGKSQALKKQRKIEEGGRVRVQGFKNAVWRELLIFTAGEEETDGSCWVKRAEEKVHA